MYARLLSTLTELKRTREMGEKKPLSENNSHDVVRVVTKQTKKQLGVEQWQSLEAKDKTAIVQLMLERQGASGTEEPSFQDFPRLVPDEDEDGVLHMLPALSPRSTIRKSRRASRGK